MKHLLHKLNSLRLLTLLTLLLGVGGSQVWADTSTLSFAAACGSSGTAEADDGVKWTVASDGSESTYDSNKGIHYGTGSAAVQYIKLSTSGISGTITQVVANASTASGVSATVSVTVGGSAFGGDAKSLSSSAANYTFNGSAEGAIVVTVTKPSSATKALYVKSITVTYKTVTDARTAVNLSDFTANNTTLIAGGSPSSTSTSATNDQAGWTAAYTYSSSNTDVATVDANGVIEAVAKGTATITCSLNVSPSDASYKAGTTTSKTIEITVKNPSHIVTFSSNGSTYGEPASVEEGESITLPAENPKEVNGYTFRGWKAGTIDGTTDEEPTYVTSSPVMGDADVTYYAVFAEVVKGNITTKTDILTNETTGITGTNYKTWGYESKTSGAVYAGNSAGGNSSIQLRSTENSGIVTTQSGGKVTKIEVEWDSNTSSGRTLNVYGRDNAYNGVYLLYSYADPIGTITYGNSTELDISAGYKYIGIRSEDKALYLKSVSITWTTVTPDTYAHYCTTVSALPRPIITMEDVEMTWGDDDKYVAPSATINAKAYNGSFSYTVDKPGLTVAADGKLTSNTPGTYVVTANIAATAEHQAASKTCTVTVGKQNVTLSFAETTVHKKTSDASYTQTATATPTEYDGTIAYSKDEESTSENAAVNSSSAAVTFSATGSVIVKATAPATDYYNSAEATYTILIQTDPTIVVKDANIAYGKTFTVDGIEGGNITVTSSNPAVASVAGLVITSHAVGTTTITVATAESDTYVEGKETFTLTVTAPEGKTTAKPAVSSLIFGESFGDNSEKARTWDDEYSVKSGVAAVYADITGYTVSNVKQGKNTTGFVKSGLNQSSEGTDASIIIGPLNVADYKDLSLTYQWKAASINRTYSTAAYYATSAEGEYTEVTGTGDGATTFVERSYALPAAAQVSTLYLKIVWNTSNTQGIIDEIQLFGTGVAGTETVKLNASGYATYCSEYPLDFTNAEADGYSAWAVSSVNGETGEITFSQIKGTVKGGTGVLLKGTAGATVQLESAASTNEPTNKLEGTLAPTYVEANKYYGLSGNTFKKINAGTVPAGKAMLPASAVNGSSQGVKAFTFVFGDTTTGVNAVDNGQWTMDNGAIFSLSGQRLAKPQKGINIINGKKVLVK